MQIQSKWLMVAIATGLLASTAMVPTVASAADTNFLIKSVKVVSPGGAKSGNCNTVDVVIVQTGKPKDSQLDVRLSTGHGTKYYRKGESKIVDFKGGTGPLKVRFDNVVINQPSPNQTQFLGQMLGYPGGRNLGDANSSDDYKRGSWAIEGRCANYVGTTKGNSYKPKETYQAPKQYQEPQHSKPKTMNDGAKKYDWQ